MGFNSCLLRLGKWVHHSDKSERLFSDSASRSFLIFWHILYFKILILKKTHDVYYICKKNLNKQGNRENKKIAGNLSNFTPINAF